MSYLRSSFVVASLALMLFLPARVHAAAVFTLDNLVTAMAGTTVTLYGTISVDAGDPDPTFLNGLDLTIDLPLLLEDVPFFSNAPTSLSISGTASTGLVALLNVVIPISANAGFYSGSMSILGGALDSDFNQLGTQDFRIEVTSANPTVPEPATMLLVGSAFAGLVLTRRRNAKTVAA